LYSGHSKASLRRLSWQGLPVVWSHMAREDGWLAWLSPRWHRQGHQGHRIGVGTDGVVDEGYRKRLVCV